MNKKQMMEIVLSFLNDIDRGTADKIIKKSVNYNNTIINSFKWINILNYLLIIFI